MAAPRIAFFDIETAPIQGYAWEPYDTNLMHTIEPTFMLAYALKWADSDKVKTRTLSDYPGYSRRKTCDKALVTELHRDMGLADIVVAHNGDSFDIKKSNARFAVHDLGALPPRKSIDTLKIARRNFKFDSNKLDNIARYLGLGRKMPHTGKDMWLGCINGDPKAWRMMRKYNAQDVRLLEAVYMKIRSWDRTHPNLAAYDETPGCPVCRSTHTRKNGVHVNKVRKVQRHHCQDCGHWFLGDTIKKGEAA